MVLFVLQKLIFQTRMRSHPVGLDVWCLVGPFVYCHTLCLRTAKALVKLRRCAGSPESSLVVYVISTIMSWAGSSIALNYAPPPPLTGVEFGTFFRHIVVTPYHYFPTFWMGVNTFLQRIRQTLWVTFRISPFSQCYIEFWRNRGHAISVPANEIAVSPIFPMPEFRTC